MLGLVVGGALTVISWRLAFLINFPIGIIIIWIALTRLEETRHERLKLDVTGALVATLGCTAAVPVFTQGPPRGWVDPWVIGAGVLAVLLGVAFLYVERRADHPLVPLWLFRDRNRVATFVSLFLAGGVLLTLTVMIGLYVQDVLGYSALHAGIGFIPFALALGFGNLLTARLAPHRAALADHRRRHLRAGRDDLRVYAEPLHPVLPDLLLPIVVGGFGIGIISVVLPLCAGQHRASRDRPDQRHHADGAEPRRAAGAGDHPGRADLAHLSTSAAPPARCPR